MYAIQINDENTMTAIIKQEINQGYKLADWFWFLTSPYYQGRNMASYSAFVEFTLPVSKSVITEKLTVKSELYNDNLKYCISSKSKITAEIGTVKLKVLFKDDEGTVIRQTVNYNLSIVSNDEWHDNPDYEEPEEEIIEEIIKRTRPLLFNSVEEAENRINSDEIENIYLGRFVNIVEDDKYVLYSIQQSKTEPNKYVVDPVDTYGEGAVWEDEDNPNANQNVNP